MLKTSGEPHGELRVINSARYILGKPYTSSMMTKADQIKPVGSVTMSFAFRFNLKIQQLPGYVRGQDMKQDCVFSWKRPY